MSHRKASLRESGAAFEGIISEDDSLSLLADTNAFLLISSGCVNESCVLHENVLRFSLNVDAEPFSFRTVIADDAMLYPVTVAAPKVTLRFTKQNPHLAVAFDGASSDHVVRVTMADTDPVPFVLRQRAIFHDPVRNAPAKENSLAVSPG